MSSPLERQNNLPKSIKLFRCVPDRQPFSWENWRPAKVLSAADLPPYLILGDLKRESFKISEEGWSACWQGCEHDTHFDIQYLAHRARYEIRQTWCGVGPVFASGSSDTPLDKLICQTCGMHFPSSWDGKAKKDIEGRFQITFFEQPQEYRAFYFLPDGAFTTIAFPVAIKEIRPMRERLRKIASGLRYPLRAEAKLLFQAINYIEGKAPEWTTQEIVVFNHSIGETGTVPWSLPVRETASSGSSAWTLRRDIYVVFLWMPFAGLTDFLERVATANGPIRLKTGPALRVEMQPVVMPATFEVQTTSIALFDNPRTTRCLWQFSPERMGHDTPDIQAANDDYAEDEDSLVAAETISEDVTQAVNQMMNDALGTDGR